MHYKYIFIFCVGIFIGKTYCYPRLVFLSAHFGIQPPAANNVAIQPALNYSLEEMSRLYPDVLGNYSYTAMVNLKAESSCGLLGAAASQDLMIDFYTSGLLAADALVVLFVPLCGPSFMNFGDFSREMDFLTIPCTVADGLVQDRGRFPNTISFAPAVTSPFGEAILVLLQTYSWTSIVIINDQLTGNILAARSLEECRAPMNEIQNHRAEIQFLVINVDSASAKFTYHKALQQASRFSRIILSCTLGPPQRQMLAAAHDLGMTKGDYVFIHLFEIEAPQEPPLWWSVGDDIDEKVRQAFQSLLVVRSAPILWEKAENLTLKFQQRRHEIFGYTKYGDEKNEFTFPSYEAAYALTKVLREFCQNNDPRCHSGRYIASKMLNQTHDLPFRPVTITPNGSRLIEAYVQQYDPVDDALKAIYIYDSFLKILQPSIERIPTWLGGQVPSSRPKCGFQNEYCYKGSNSLAIILGTIFAMLFVVVAGWIIWARCIEAADPDWWMLPSETFYVHQENK